MAGVGYFGDCGGGINVSNRNWQDLYERLITRTLSEFPEFRIRNLKEFWLFRILNLKNRAITVGRTIYVDDGFVQGNKAACFILAHEFVHMWDCRELGSFCFYQKYFSPQWYGLIWLVFSFLFFPFSVICWVGCLIASIVSFFPWPSKGRTLLELRGYGMSLAMEKWIYGEYSDQSEEYVKVVFDGWMYYKMWPFLSDLQIKIGNLKYWIVCEPYRTRTLFGISGIPYGKIRETIDGWMEDSVLLGDSNLKKL